MAMQPADRELLFEDFIPQAEFKYPVKLLQGRLDLLEAQDDLDEFVGGAFLADDGFPFTIKHYKGSEPDTFTIYFGRVAVDQIPIYVERIISDLKVPAWAKTWDRSLTPEL